MANISSIKLPNGTTYSLKDNGALQLTGGQVTGPVTFGDSIYADDLTAGQLVVDGSASVANNLQVNTINGVTVGSSPKFTDTPMTVTTTGSGNAVTAVSASGTTITVTKGATYSNNAGTITGVTAGTGLSGGGTSGTVTLNHSNSVTAQTTQAIYPIKIDAQGHISAYGTAVTPLTSHQTIKQDGVTGATGNHFGTCSVAAGTAAKTVSITAGTPVLEAGLRVIVKFSNANTAGTPTLNVNSLGAKNIFHNGAQITTGSNKALLAGTVEFVYDGTQWQLIGNYIDTNTTYTLPTTANSATTGITASTTANKTTVGSHSTDYGVKAAGSGSFTSGAFSGGSGSFSATVSSHVLSFSHTHTAATHAADSHTHTAPTLGSKVPTVSTASATVSITDNGHTHTLS